MNWIPELMRIADANGGDLMSPAVVERGRELWIRSLYTSGGFLIDGLVQMNGNELEIGDK